MYFQWVSWAWKNTAGTNLMTCCSSLCTLLYCPSFLRNRFYYSPFLKSIFHLQALEMVQFVPSPEIPWTHSHVKNLLILQHTLPSWGLSWFLYMPSASIELMSPLPVSQHLSYRTLHILILNENHSCPHITHWSLHLNFSGSFLTTIGFHHPITQAVIQSTLTYAMCKVSIRPWAEPVG